MRHNSRARFGGPFCVWEIGHVHRTSNRNRYPRRVRCLAYSDIAVTPKQIRFVEEYLIDLNATQAAIRAGYSPATAEQQGYQLLQKTSVAEAIEKSRQERSDRLKIDASWVLNRAVDLINRCKTENDRTNERQTLDLIGKHVGVQAFKERLELDGHVTTEPLGLSDLLGELREAAREGDAKLN